MNATSRLFVILAIVIVVLGAFVAYTTLRPEVLVYAAIGVGLCAFLAVFFRKNKMRPLFEPREETKP